MRDQFTSPQVRKIIDMDRELFRYCLNEGYITATVQRSTKQGEKNIHDRIDIYAAALYLHFVRNLKMKREQAGYHAAVWQDRARAVPASPQAAASLYNHLFFMRSGEDIISCEYFGADRSSNFQAYQQIMGRVFAQVEGKQWDDVLVVNMGKIVNDIESKISKTAK